MSWPIEVPFCVSFHVRRRKKRKTRKTKTIFVINSSAAHRESCERHCHIEAVFLLESLRLLQPSRVVRFTHTGKQILRLMNVEKELSELAVLGDSVTKKAATFRKLHGDASSSLDACVKEATSLKRQSHALLKQIEKEERGGSITREKATEFKSTLKPVRFRLWSVFSLPR